MSGARLLASGTEQTKRRYYRGLLRPIVLICLLAGLVLWGVGASAAQSQTTSDACAGSAGCASSGGGSSGGGSSGGGSSGGGNAAPTARDDRFGVNEDGKLTVRSPGVLRNDGGKRLSAARISGPRHGRLALRRDGSFVYVPNKNYNGPDSFAYKATNGKSDRATVRIGVKAVNDAPVVSTSGGTTTFTENGSGVKVDDLLTVTDVDSANLRSAVVSITSNFDNGDDTLSFTDQNGISGTYNGATGVLSMSGNATKTQYQSALRSITFSTPGEDPSGARRTVSFRANDGVTSGPVATHNLAVTTVNDAPTATDGAASTTEDTARSINLQATDPDGDQLSFTITDDPDHGTLSGTGASRTYTPSANYSGDDFLLFEVSDGKGGTDTGRFDLTITPANDAPVVNTSGGATSFTEGDPATTIDGALTVSDADDTNLEEATVSITSNLQNSDVLAFADQNGITGSYNSGTGVLTLTGTASLADYQSALRSIEFDSTNDDPSASKAVEFEVNDGDTDSNAATKSIDITGVKDSPTLNTSSGPTEFTEDSSGAVAVDNALTLNDPDSANFQGATVQITGNFSSAEDDLAFTNQAGITGSYNDTTGTLTLSGTDTVANYEAALRSVQYNNTDTVAPSTLTRTVRFQATDSSGSASNTATKNVTVTSVNDAPVVATTNGSTAYTEGESATAVDSGITITDQDDADLNSAQIRISSGFQAGDDLFFVNTAQISGSYNTGTGLLTLIGTDSVADYESALRSIQFQTTSDSPVASKTIEFKVNDGDTDSNAPTKEITLTSQPDPPVVTSGETLNYTENDPATAVHSDLAISDPEGDNITHASASLTNSFQAGEDALSWADNNASDNITLDASNSDAQTVVLTGADTAANYQAAMRAVKYSNNSESPATSNRTVTFSATDQPGDSGTGTRSISVTAVDDPLVAVNDSATVLEDAAATSIPVLTNDTDVDAGPKTISSATDPANGTVVLTGGSPGAHAGLTYQPDPNYCNDPPNTTPDTFTYTVNGGSNATVSMTVTCVNDAPVADDETFNGNDSAIGNTSMVVNDPDDGAPSVSSPKTTVTGDILAGDTDIDSAASALTVTPGTFATNDGGSVTLESDGDFTFHPAASTSCTDTSDFFDYTVEDSGSPKQTDTGRVTIAIAGCVWYANNNAAGNSGTSSRPFDTIQQAETASGSNHTVFVFDGDDTSTGYGGDGYAMNSGERLIGEHEGLVVDPDQGGSLTADILYPANPGAHPTLTANNEDVVSLDDGNEMRGLTVDPSGTGGGIAGGSADSAGATIDDVNITDGGTAGSQAGLELDSTTGTFNVSNLVVNNKATGVRLHNTTTPANAVNAVFAPASQISITSAGGLALDADGTPAVPVNLGTSTFDDITVTGSNSGGVSLSNTTGTTNLGDGSGNEVSLTTSGAAAAMLLNQAGAVVLDGGGTDSAVNTSGGPALDASNLSGALLSFDTLSSSGSSTDGIRVDNVSGLVSGIGGALQNATEQDVDISGNNSGDTVDFSYGGTIADSSGTIVSIANQNGGTKDFNGAITSTGAVVQLTNNSGATMRFDGGLTLSTGALAALSATGGGTLAVTNQAGGVNTLTTGSGTALNVQNTTIHDDDLTFRSIASNGAASGIRLNSTGSRGGLSVTGTGVSPSGGTITNSSGVGMEFTNVGGGVSLDGVNVTNGRDDGINATTVPGGFTLADSVIRDNGIDDNPVEATRATEDRGLDFLNVSGAINILRSTIANSTDTNAHLDNTSPDAATVTVTSSTFSGAENTGFHFGGTGDSTLNATVTQSTFAANRDVGFRMHSNAGSTTRQTLKFDNNDLSGGHPLAVPGRPQISINSDGGLSSTSVVKVTITNNNIKSGLGSEVILNTAKNATSQSTFDALVTGNDIGDAQPGTADPGVDGGSAIWGWAHGAGTTRMEIRNNTVQNWGGRALELGHNDGNGTADYTVSNNTLSNGDQTNNRFEGIYAYSGGAGGCSSDGSFCTPPDQSNVCIDMDNNDMDGIGHQGVSDMAIDRFTGAQLRFAGVNSTDMNVLQTSLRAANPSSPAFTVETFSNTQTATTANSCALPLGTP